METNDGNQNSYTEETFELIEAAGQDTLLTLLVDTINKEPKQDADVTLFIQGIVVSGEVIAHSDYLIGALHYSEEKALSMRNTRTPKYIHMKNLRFIYPYPLTISSPEKPAYARFKIADVSGWMEGLVVRS